MMSTSIAAQAMAVPAEPVNARLLEALSALLDDIEALIGESAGVYGLHLNGDVSPWSELEEGGRFERLSSMSRAREAIAAAAAAHTEPVNARLIEALRSIQRYGLDTLSGRADGGDDDRAWQRAAVNEMTKRARIALSAAEAQQSDALEQVRAEEREACAKACMDEARKWPYPSHGNAAASMCAKMIFDMRQK